MLRFDLVGDVARVPRVRARRDDLHERAADADPGPVRPASARSSRRAWNRRAALHHEIGRRREPGRSGDREPGPYRAVGTGGLGCRRHLDRPRRRPGRSGDLRHGRHVDRRQPGRGRRPGHGQRDRHRRLSDPDAVDRRGLGRRRRRLDRMARAGRPASRRAEKRGRGARAGVLRTGRRGADDLGRQPLSRPPAGEPRGRRGDVGPSPRRGGARRARDAGRAFGARARQRHHRNRRAQHGRCNPPGLGPERQGSAIVRPDRLGWRGPAARRQPGRDPALAPDFDSAVTRHGVLARRAGLGRARGLRADRHPTRGRRRRRAHRHAVRRA